MSDIEAIPQRGEVKIELGGETLLGRLSIGEVIKLEKRLKMPLIKFYKLIEELDASTPEMVAAFKAMFIGGKNEGIEITDDFVHDLIDKEGYMNTYRVLAEALMGVLDTSGNARAAFKEKALQD